MSAAERYPVCPRCDKPVKIDEHVLRLTLVNAHPSAPPENTDITGTFHHGCAANVWNAALSEWRAAAGGRSG